MPTKANIYRCGVCDEVFHCLTSFLSHRLLHCDYREETEDPCMLCHCKLPPSMSQKRHLMVNHAVPLDEDVAENIELETIEISETFTTTFSSDHAVLLEEEADVTNDTEFEKAAVWDMDATVLCSDQSSNRISKTSSPHIIITESNQILPFPVLSSHECEPKRSTDHSYLTMQAHGTVNSLFEYNSSLNSLTLQKPICGGKNWDDKSHHSTQCNVLSENSRISSGNTHYEDDDGLEISSNQTVDHTTAVSEFTCPTHQWVGKTEEVTSCDFPILSDSAISQTVETNYCPGALQSIYNDNIIESVAEVIEIPFNQEYSSENIGNLPSSDNVEFEDVNLNRTASHDPQEETHSINVFNTTCAVFPNKEERSYSIPYCCTLQENSVCPDINTCSNKRIPCNQKFPIITEETDQAKTKDTVSDFYFLFGKGLNMANFLNRESRLFQCLHCKFCGKRKLSLLNHMKRAHSDMLYIHSKLDIKNKYPLMDGDLVVMKMSEYLKENLNVTKTRRRKRSRQVEHQDIPGHYKCHICNKVFTRLRYLRRHQNCHRAEKTQLCEACGKSFKTRASLKIHQCTPRRTSYMYQCPKCNFSSSIRAAVSQHHQIHPDGSIVCDVCGVAYTDKSTLRKHQRVHDISRPFPCTYEGCTWRFKTVMMQRAHVRAHTSKGQFCCPHCGYHFRQKHHLKRHIVRFHASALQTSVTSDVIPGNDCYASTELSISPEQPFASVSDEFMSSSKVCSLISTQVPQESTFIPNSEDPPHVLIDKTNRLAPCDELVYTIATGADHFVVSSTVDSEVTVVEIQSDINPSCELI